MSLKVGDRIRQNTLSTGVGGVSLVGDIPGFKRFSDVLSSGDITYYVIEENDKFEVGVGVYGSDNLERFHVLSSSNSGSKIELGGSGAVFVTYPADKSVIRDLESQIIVGASGLVFENGVTFKEAKIVELTDVNLEGTPSNQYLIDFNTTNKSLVIGESAGPSNSRNTLIGHGAGSGITSGVSNTNIGTDAGHKNEQGFKNVSVGDLSGPSDENASISVSRTVNVGYQAGEKSRDDSVNIGYQAGAAAYSRGHVSIGSFSGSGIGSYSFVGGYEAAQSHEDDYLVAIGYRSAKNGGGESAIWIGKQAGQDTSSAINSIGMGELSGQGSSGNHSIYLGKKSGKDNSTNDMLFVSNDAPSSEGTLIKGDFSSKRLAVGKSDVALSDAFYVGVNSATDNGIVVQGASLQSSDLTQWRAFDGQSVASVSNSGTILANGISASGQGVRLDSSTPIITGETLYNVAGSLYWNGTSLSDQVSYASGLAVVNESDIAYVSGIVSENTADDTYVSGVAVYSSGQVIANQVDISYVSGVAVYASGNVYDDSYISGVAVYSSGQAVANQSNISTNSSRVTYASGQAIQNEFDIAYVSGIAAHGHEVTQEELSYVSGIAVYASGNVYDDTYVSGVATYSSGVLVDGGTLIPDADKGITIAKGSENFPITITQDENISGGAHYIRITDNDTDNITFGGTDADAFQITASGEGSSGAENILKFSAVANDDRLVFGGSTVPTKVLGSRIDLDGPLYLDSPNASFLFHLSYNGSEKFRFNYAQFYSNVAGAGALLGKSDKYWGGLYSRNAYLKGHAATNVPLTIDAQAAQSANLTEWKASDGVVVAQVEPDGSIATSGDISSSGTLIAGELKSPQDTGGLLRLRGSNDTYLDVTDGTMNFYCNTGQAFRLTSSFVDVFKTIRPISNQDLGRTSNRWPNLYAVGGSFTGDLNIEPSGSFKLFNIGDSHTNTTNTEFLTLETDSNNYRILTDLTGSGTQRDIRIGGYVGGGFRGMRFQPQYNQMQMIFANAVKMSLSASAVNISTTVLTSKEHRPYVSDTYSNGTPTFRWADTYSVNGSFTGSVSGARGFFESDTTTDSALTITSAASQTANLQEWRASDDVVIAQVAPDGSIATSGDVNVSGVVAAQTLSAVVKQYATPSKVTFSDGGWFGYLHGLNGSVAFRWDHTGNTVYGRIQPGSNNSVSNGTSAYRWSDFYSVDGSFSGTLDTEVGGSNRIFNLGSDADVAAGDTEYLEISWDTDVATIANRTTGTGGQRDLVIQSGMTNAELSLKGARVALYDGNNRMLNVDSSSVQIYGLLRPSHNNTRDIGSTTHRWRDLYSVDGDFSGSVSGARGFFESATTTDSALTITSAALQTANLTEWRASDDIVVAQVESDGSIASSGNISASGTVSAVDGDFSGTITAGDGSHTAPSYSFDSQSTMGIYRAAVGQINMVAQTNGKGFNLSQNSLSISRDMAFGWRTASNISQGHSFDTLLARDEAGIIAQRNFFSNDPQAFRVYGSGNPTNGEWIQIDHGVTHPNIATISNTENGDGTGRHLYVKASDQLRFYSGSNLLHWVHTNTQAIFYRDAIRPNGYSEFGTDGNRWAIGWFTDGKFSGSVSGARGYFESSNTTDSALTITSAVSQTANLQEWRASDDVVIAQVAPDGSIASSGDISASGTVTAPLFEANQKYGFSGDTNTFISNIGGSDWMGFTVGGLSWLSMNKASTDRYSWFNANQNQTIAFRVGYNGGRGIDMDGATGDVTFGTQILSSGVQASGLLLHSHTPTVTTNKLYNDGGTLTFNGSAVGGGGTDAYTSGVAAYASGNTIATQAIANYASGNTIATQAVAEYASGVVTGGTPSGIAFFGADGLLKDSTNLRFKETDGKLGIGLVSNNISNNLTVYDSSQNYPLRVGNNTANNHGVWTGMTFFNSTNTLGGSTQEGQASIRAYRYGTGHNGELEFLLGGTSVMRIDTEGHTGLGTITPDAKLHTVSTNATDVGIIAQGAAAQSANLTEWRASDDVVIAQVAPDGSIATSGDVSVSGTVTTANIDSASSIVMRLNSVPKFSVSSNGINYSYQSLQPDQNGTRSLGASPRRWSNTYSVDGDFSNTVSTSGIQASGLLLHSHTPTVTTNKLYNDGGTLTFNGSAVGGSVTGTPSGVAFFGDDGSITDSLGLSIRQSGNYGNHVQIGINTGPSYLPANSPDRLLAAHSNIQYRTAAMELKHTGYGNTLLSLIAASGGRSAGIKMSSGANHWWVGPQSSSMSMGADTTLLASKDLDATRTVAFDGAWGRMAIGGVYPGASLHVKTNHASLFPVGLFQGTASQVANLTEWRASDDVVVAQVEPDGSIATSGDVSVSGVVKSQKYLPKDDTAQWQIGHQDTRAGIQWTNNQLSMILESNYGQNITVADGFNQIGQQTFPRLTNTYPLGLDTRRWSNVLSVDGSFTDTLNIEPSGSLKVFGVGDSHTNTTNTELIDIYHSGGHGYIVTDQTGTGGEQNLIIGQKSQFNLEIGQDNGIKFRFGTADRLSINQLCDVSPLGANKRLGTGDSDRWNEFWSVDGNFSGSVSGARGFFESATTTDSALTITSAVSQTANLTEWKNSGDDVLTKVTSDGSVHVSGVIASESDGEIRSYILGKPGDTDTEYLRIGDVGGILHDIKPYKTGSGQNRHIRINSADGRGKLNLYSDGHLNYFFNNTHTFSAFHWGISVSGEIRSMGDEQASLGQSTNPFANVYSTNGTFSGITSSGVTLQSNVPTSTTDTLYNDGGTLMFNGSAVGGSVTGTPSGVAFFADDGSLTDSADFIVASGNEGRFVGVNSDGAPDKTLVVGNKKYLGNAGFKLVNYAKGNALLEIVATSGGRTAGIKLSNGTNDWWSGPLQNSLAGLGARHVIASYELDNTKSMVYDTNGNVVIGGTSPSARLHVNALNSSSVNSIFQAASAQSANITEWRASDGVAIASVSADGSIASSGNIGASGSIGIGMFTAGDRLTVAGNLSTKHSSQVSNALRVTHNSNDVYLSLYKRANQSTAEIKFGTAGDSYFNAGNLGVGTTSPSATLDVSGDLTVNSGITTVNDATSSDKVLLRLESSTGAEVLTFKNSNSNTTPVPLVTYPGGYFSMYNGFQVRKNAATGMALYVTNSSAHTKWRVNAEGSMVFGGSSSLYSVNPRGMLDIYCNSSTSKGVIVQGAAAQSENLTQWQASDEVVVASVSADGSIASSGNISASGNITTQGELLTDTIRGIVQFKNIASNYIQLDGSQSGSNNAVMTSRGNRFTITAENGFGNNLGLLLLNGVGGTYLQHDSDTKLSTTSTGVSVDGHFTATSKSFLIDHPTKKDAKLQYASLEGPENGVYVRGSVTENVIELPDHWTGLVDEESITVQLTAKGHPQPNMFVRSIVNNKVYISSDVDIDAFYNVYAERKDIDKLEVEIWQ